MKVVYHGSPIANLTEITPSNRGYICATQSISYAAFFATEKTMRDFDGDYGGKNGIPYFKEGFAGALERRLKGSKGYIYELPADAFQKYNSMEVISYNPVKTLRRIEVDDLCDFVLKEVENGNFLLERYSQEEKYRKTLNIKIFKNMLDWDIMNCKNDDYLKKYYDFCKEHYPELLQKYEDLYKIL